MRAVRLLIGSTAAAAWLISAGLVAQTPAAANRQPDPVGGRRGADLFRTYCASCHGTAARGDGPLAAAMVRRPPNLTEIAKRNKGTFPREMIYRIIDGRQKVAGHGGPDMPVWGDALMRTAGADEASVKTRIEALVDYLESIQAREGA
jgi:mono/diheme cytochrome c family protein